MRMKTVIFSVAVMLIVAASAAAQTSITPVFSHSNVQEVANSTTLQNSDVVITAANLQSGVDYLVFYTVSYGSNGTSNVPEVAVTYGATTIAYGADEGSSSGAPEAMRVGSLHGYYVLTGDGISDPRIQFSEVTGASCWIIGKSLVAIPLTDLIVDQDYWYAVQNGDAAEVSTTSSFARSTGNRVSSTANLIRSSSGFSHPHPVNTSRNTFAVLVTRSSYRTSVTGNASSDTQLSTCSLHDCKT